MQDVQLEDEPTTDALIRNDNRKRTMYRASMALYDHYTSDPINDSPLVAQDKIDAVVDEVYETNHQSVAGYQVGNKRQRDKLIAKLDAIEADPAFADYGNQENVIVKDILHPGWNA